MQAENKIPQRREGQVPSCLDNLERQVTQTEENVELLEKVLSTAGVLKNEGTTAGEDAKCQTAAKVALAVRVEGIEQRVSASNARLFSIVQRLEI